MGIRPEGFKKTKKCLIKIAWIVTVNY